jgi:putative oxidoreductase
VNTTAGVIVLAGRVLFGVFFLMSAFGHVTKRQMMSGYAQSVGFPAPYIAGWPAGLWLGAGALSIAIGIWPDIGALMLAAFLVLATLFFHRFWEVEDPSQKQTQMGNFNRNVTLMGAALALFGFFAVAGDSLRFAVTGSLMRLR